MQRAVMSLARPVAAVRCVAGTVVRARCARPQVRHATLTTWTPARFQAEGGDSASVGATEAAAGEAPGQTVPWGGPAYKRSPELEAAHARSRPSRLSQALKRWVHDDEPTRRVRPTVFATIHCSFNNTIVTFSKMSGDVVAVKSGGSQGYRKSQRSSSQAAYAAAKAAAEAAALLGYVAASCVPCPVRWCIGWPCAGLTALLRAAAVFMGAMWVAGCGWLGVQVPICESDGEGPVSQPPGCVAWHRRCACECDRDRRRHAAAVQWLPPTESSAVVACLVCNHTSNSVHVLVYVFPCTASVGHLTVQPRHSAVARTRPAFPGGRWELNPARTGATKRHPHARPGCSISSQESGHINKWRDTYG